MIRAAAPVIRALALRMMSSGRARGSLPAQLATCGHVQADSSMPRRAAAMKATESAVSFWMPRQPAVLAPGGWNRSPSARM